MLNAPKRETNNLDLDDEDQELLYARKSSYRSRIRGGRRLLLLVVAIFLFIIGGTTTLWPGMQERGALVEQASSSPSETALLHWAPVDNELDLPPPPEPTPETPPPQNPEPLTAEQAYKAVILGSVVGEPTLGFEGNSSSLACRFRLPLFREPSE